MSEFGEPKAYDPAFYPTTSPLGLPQPPALLEPERARFEQTLELGDTGLVPLEVRRLHDPDADEGFVGATSGSASARRACCRFARGKR